MIIHRLVGMRCLRSYWKEKKANTEVLTPADATRSHITTVRKKNTSVMYEIAT